MSGGTGVPPVRERTAPVLEMAPPLRQLNGWQARDIQGGKGKEKESGGVFLPLNLKGSKGAYLGRKGA